VAELAVGWGIAMPESPGRCPYDCDICQPLASGTGYAAGGAARWPLQLPGVQDMTDWTISWHPAGAGVPEVGGHQALEREAARRQAEECAMARARAREERARAIAQEEGEQLLLDWLSPAQQRDYRERRQFDVTGSDGSGWRILCQGRTGNVQHLDRRGEWTRLYCAHPRGLPDPLTWLAQAMALAHDAPGFLRTANVYGTRSTEIGAVEELPLAAALAAAASARRWPLFWRLPVTGGPCAGVCAGAGAPGLG
jgi:hypothetical protein